jgi:hypothetical protein
MIGNFLKMFVVYKEDCAKGKKPWEDPALLALAVGYLCTIAAKYWGLEIKPDEQAGVVVVIGTLFRLASPHVGFKADKPIQVTAIKAFPVKTAPEIVAEGPNEEVTTDRLTAGHN